MMGNGIASKDQAFCVALLPKVSRTFALSIEGLPEVLRDAVRTAYLLCRVVDTIEDDNNTTGKERQVLFDLFDAALENDNDDPSVFEDKCRDVKLGDKSSERELCYGVGAVFRIFRNLPSTQRDAIRGPVKEMSEGMREYSMRFDEAGSLYIWDLEDLERYCYYVAGTVGKLLTALFEQVVPLHSAQMRERAWSRAVSFGLGLQMVNIVKDVGTDFDRGVCFLPQSLARRHGVVLENVLDPEQRESVLGIVRAVCDRAREHLKRAYEYTMVWPLPEGAAVRLFCVVPLALAMATLKEVEKGTDTLCPGKTPKVSRRTVYAILSGAKQAISTDHGLDSMLSQYRA
ncbi:MAG: phytoene/squalene synthase family protein [Pseudomonadota bacterium]